MARALMCMWCGCTLRLTIAGWRSTRFNHKGDVFSCYHRVDGNPRAGHQLDLRPRLVRLWLDDAL